MAGWVRSDERTLDSQSHELTSSNALSGHSRAGFMSHTIKDIARLAGVSTATVSRVINGFEQVSDETRSRVLSLISESYYRPNAHAIELVRGRRHSSKLRAMSEASEVEGEVRHDRTRRSQRQEQKNKLDLLKRENTKLRNLLGSLYEQIARWQVRERRPTTAKGSAL